jgi:flagellar FliL protein
MAGKAAKAGAEDEGEGDAKPGRKRAGLAGLLRNKLVIVGLAVLLLGGAGAFGAMQMGLFGGGHAEDAAAEEHAAEPADAHDKAGGAEGGHGEGKKVVTFVDLPEMTVNLDSRDRPQYLKVRIALEVAEEKSAQDIQPLMPRVLDTFQIYMRQLRPSDLEGSAGLFRLKEELTKRVNVSVYPAKVDAVLFKEIVVQ